MQRVSCHATCALVVLLSIGLSGCARSLAPPPSADSPSQPKPELPAEGFPAVERFALDRAGSSTSQLILSSRMLSLSEFAMFPYPHRVASAVALLCVMACTSCANPQPSPAVLAQTNFPIVEPFAVERAGSTLTVEFELPGAREGTQLRPVFIGIQRVSDPAGGSASELQRLIRIDEYLLREALPVRLMLTRVDGGVLGPSIELQEPTVNDGQSPAVRYTPLVNGVSVRHTNVTVDGSEALAAGKYDLNKVYYSVQLARIDPPTPGRYRLTAESLSSHPQLKGATLQLVVSHHHRKAIY